MRVVLQLAAVVDVVVANSVVIESDTSLTRVACVCFFLMRLDDNVVSPSIISSTLQWQCLGPRKAGIPRPDIIAIN